MFLYRNNINRALKKKHHEKIK